MTAEAPVQAVIVPGLCVRGAREDVTACLADVGGRPFLDYLVEDCVRFGFLDLLLLASDRPEPFEGYASKTRTRLRRGVTLQVTPRRLEESIGALQSSFLLLDGDRHFDFNWLDLMLGVGAGGVIAARERAAAGNAGVYLVERTALGALRGEELDTIATSRRYDGAMAELRSGRGLAQLPERRRRPAVFFDRDGTINVDVGYAHRAEQLELVAGAISAVKRVNDAGYYAFLVTNQSGVARGYYTEDDVHAFHAHLQRWLRAKGAHFDDIRYCPYHPDGSVPAYARRSDWRKPEPGMINDLMQHWPVVASASLAIGDQDSDVAAARAAGLQALRYRGDDLDALLSRHLTAPRR